MPLTVPSQSAKLPTCPGTLLANILELSCLSPTLCLQSGEDLALVESYLVQTNSCSRVMVRRLRHVPQSAVVGGKQLRGECQWRSPQRPRWTHSNPCEAF